MTARWILPQVGKFYIQCKEHPALFFCGDSYLNVRSSQEALIRYSCHIQAKWSKRHLQVMREVFIEFYSHEATFQMFSRAISAA